MGNIFSTTPERMRNMRTIKPHLTRTNLIIERKKHTSDHIKQMNDINKHNKNELETIDKITHEVADAQPDKPGKPDYKNKTTIEQNDMQDEMDTKSIDRRSPL